MKNKRNIQKALESLPKLKAPDSVWKAIEREMEEEQCEFNLEVLPQRKAPDHVWGAIENELDEEQSEINAAFLPGYIAPDKVWQQIDKELSRPKLIHLNSKRRQLATIASIAAILLIGLFLSNKFINRYDISVEYSEEIEDAFGDSGFELSDPGISDIIANCEASPEICSSPVFKDFQLQLKEVSKELDELKGIINRDPDPHLLKFYYQLENERVDIEKSIVKLFV